MLPRIATKPLRNALKVIGKILAIYPAQHGADYGLLVNDMLLVILAVLLVVLERLLVIGAIPFRKAPLQFHRNGLVIVFVVFHRLVLSLSLLTCLPRGKHG